MIMLELRKSILVSIWFMFLTFPIMVIRVNAIEKTVVWRWENMAWIGIGSFLLSFVWRWALRRKEAGDAVAASGEKKTGKWAEFSANPSLTMAVRAGFLVLFLVTPWLVTTYQTNILISFLLYVVLGLGLNVIVGVAGLLFLGHAAFYAIGAYSYALLNQYFGIGFWLALPIGGVVAALAGVALAFPVLRLRGDYLAIVTLGFGEIVRLVLENWGTLTGGPSGVSNIPRPGFMGIQLSVAEANIYIYYIVLALALITIVAVSRLKDSRIVGPCRRCARMRLRAKPWVSTGWASS